jgi:cell division septation protein DedD
MGATLRSNRLDSPYRRDRGPSNRADQSANDLAMELSRLLEQEDHVRPRVADDQYYSLRDMLARNDAKLAGARKRYSHASQFADAEQFQQHDERRHDARYANPVRAEHDASDCFDRYAGTDPHDERMYDDLPHKRRPSGLVTALALIGWASVATAGAYASRTYYFGPVSTQPSAASSQAKSAVKSAAKSAQADIRGAAPATATNGYVVQVASQRSNADAEASFRSLQKRFPNQLGNRTAIIRRVELGDKGIYYRAFVGSFASAGEADQFCGRLKAAGGQCFVTRN